MANELVKQFTHIGSENCTSIAFGIFFLGIWNKTIEKDC